jgi:hypothetical protein
MDDIEFENKLWALNSPFLWLGLLEAEAELDDEIDYEELKKCFENAGY